ncbi:hypothetical protein [Nostoc sp.]|uniref:hypothetical protein n=1 Tax=Nostoc sp. TaxID=1180 RepID=UPI002FF4E586
MHITCGSILANHIKGVVNASKLQVDVSKLQVDASKLQVDATTFEPGREGAKFKA